MKASLVGLVLMLVLALASAGWARGYSGHSSHEPSYSRRGAGTHGFAWPRFYHRRGAGTRGFAWSHSYNRRGAGTHRFVPRSYHRKAVSIRRYTWRQK